MGAFERVFDLATGRMLPMIFEPFVVCFFNLGERYRLHFVFEPAIYEDSSARSVQRTSPGSNWKVETPFNR